VVHTDVKYRSPAHTGDVTYLNATITQVGESPRTGARRAELDVEMTNQRGEVMSKGPATLEWGRS